MTVLSLKVDGISVKQYLPFGINAFINKTKGLQSLYYVLTWNNNQNAE